MLSFIFVNSILIVHFLLSLTNTPKVYYNLIIGITVAIIEGIALLLIFYLSRKASLRIAGPIYRFEQVLKALNEGDLTTRAILRKNDSFTESAQTLNESIETLRRRIESIQDSADILRNQITDDTEASQSADSLCRQLSVFKVRKDDLQDAP
jgi:methyl-accepting chemotaxis protein